MKKSITYTVPAHTLKELIAGLEVVLELRGEADIENLTINVQPARVNGRLIRASAVAIILKDLTDD